MSGIIEEKAKVYIGLLEDYELREGYSKIILKNQSGDTRVFEFFKEVKLYHPKRNNLIMIILHESGNLLESNQILMCFTDEEQIAYYERLGVEELPPMLRLFDKRSKVK